MSQPSNNQFRHESPFPGSSTLPNPPRRQFTIRRLILLVLLALIGFSLIAEIPQEIGRWQLAAALQARDAGQKDQAYIKIENAFKRFPDNPFLLFQRASWKLADGDRDGAFADCDRAVELAGKSYWALEVRSQFLQYAGRFADAVTDLKEVEVISQRSGRPRRSESLNNLAYSRALAQIELDEALDNVEAALELNPASATTRDTRGYILYLKGRYEEALKDMNFAVDGLKQEIKDSNRGISGKLRTALRSGPSLPGMDNLNRPLAVVCYHRALILLALGREQDAEADLNRVRELIGKEPDETLF